jgi:hypothetical protein
MAVLWESVLDGKYTCYVEQTDEFFGVLTIKEANKTLRQIQVSMNYSSTFGPDKLDYWDWEQIALSAIDERGDNNAH